MSFRRTFCGPYMVAIWHQHSCIWPASRKKNWFFNPWEAFRLMSCIYLQCTRNFANEPCSLKMCIHSIAKCLIYDCPQREFSSKSFKTSFKCNKWRSLKGAKAPVSSPVMIHCYIHLVKHWTSEEFANSSSERSNIPKKSFQNLTLLSSWNLLTFYVWFDLCACLVICHIRLMQGLAASRALRWSNWAISASTSTSLPSKMRLWGRQQQVITSGMKWVSKLDFSRNSRHVLRMPKKAFSTTLLLDQDVGCTMPPKLYEELWRVLREES